ncbi:hypothetical protein [Celerinatantimonas sp. MCCC 1A17872]|uniref:hypothetical protein n=1 Tax=Celerinatantimonas sp. MCCC 1A17872 TaxID=3177514 RepID=UPI0038C904AF
MKNMYIRWTSRGFFSELTILMLAKLYSEITNSNLYVDFSNNNIGSKNLNPYINIDVNELTIPILRRRSYWDHRTIQNKLIDFFVNLYYFNSTGFMSHDILFKKIWNKNFEKELLDNFKIDREYISKYFLSNWILSNNVKKRVKEIEDRNKMPSNYYSFHIRRGDKLKSESNLVNIEKYFQKLNFKEKRLSVIFIATDDIASISEVDNYLKKNKMAKKIKVVTNKNIGSGHNQSDFNIKSNKFKSELIVDLLAEVEIIRKSSFFVGSYTSNISRYIYLLRNGVDSFSVDNEFSLYY